MFVDLIFVKQQIFMCALNRRINFCRFNFREFADARKLDTCGKNWLYSIIHVHVHVHVFFVTDGHRYLYKATLFTIMYNFTCIACFRRSLSHMYMYIVLCCVVDRYKAWRI